MDDPKERILKDIETEMADARGMAARCNTWLTIAGALGFFAGAVVTILAGFKTLEGGALAALAAIPTLAAAAPSTFRLPQRIRWHTEKLLHLTELRDSLLVGLIDARQAVVRKAAILKEMEDRPAARER